MKKHGPPPCGMYKVGSLLMAFTDFFRLAQPSRAESERQLRDGRDLHLGIHLGAVDIDGVCAAALQSL
jgi:hypothetical protein